MEREITHGSLFSGIGGFDLAAEWMGWENVFHCEKDERCRNLLKAYWPNTTSYDDVKTTDFTIHRGKIDILTGGFPCQPYSNSGLRKGKDDDRHLWPEYLRAIREIRPLAVIGENVHGLLTWNDGLVFDEIHTDLESEGYEVGAFILPACGKNAPHKRDRVWFVAYSNGSDPQNADYGANREAKGNIRRNKESNVSTSLRSLGVAPLAEGDDAGEVFRRFPTESPIYRRDDGFSEELDGDWQKWSMKCLGNAISPPVALSLFRAVGQVLNST